MGVDIRLREQIALAASPADRAKHEVELALYLTRAGKFDEAREIYQKHHEASDFGENVELSLNLMLLDGLNSYYKDQAFQIGIDRLSRALRLGLSAGLTSFSSRVSAWVAHICFNSCEYVEMGSSLKRAIILASEEDVESIVRVSLTLGDALALCGDFQAATVWYGYSRTRANAIGDRLSVAAVMHNRATMALACCRFEKVCFGRESPQASAYLLEVSSAENFETYIGMGDVLYPYEVWMARLRMLEGKYFEASSIFGSYVPGNNKLAKSSMLPSVLCDWAFSNLMIGNNTGALELMNQAHRFELSGLYSDDLAVLHSYSAAILVDFNEDLRRSEFVSLAHRARDAFLDERLLLRKELSQVLACRPSFDGWPMASS